MAAKARIRGTWQMPFSTNSLYGKPAKYTKFRWILGKTQGSSLQSQGTAAPSMSVTASSIKPSFPSRRAVSAIRTAAISEKDPNRGYPASRTRAGNIGE